MSTTLPSDPIHYLNMLYHQLGNLLSTGMSSTAVVVIAICVVIGFIRPWKFSGLVWLMFAVIALALVFAHVAGKF